MVGALNPHRRTSLDASGTADLEEICYSSPMVLAPVHYVIPEEAGDAGVRKDVGIADQHFVVGKGPMPLRAASVVVVEEGHRVFRHPPDQPGGLAVRVLQPPILGVAASLLQYTFGCEVEGSRLFVGRIDPIAKVLPVLVLIVAEPLVVVLHVAPKLPNGPSGLALLAIVANILCSVALHEVEAPSVEANLEAQPPEPNADALLHLCILMVDVRCRIEVAVQISWVMFARAVRELVAQVDRPTAPIHNSGEARPVDHAGAELVPTALAVLLVTTPVVDDDVCDPTQSGGVHLLQQGL
mmetsp:Transcript_66650/g.142547  ORF Transcript_66650/g.142547 Transcript_66650/m.142547 type:complete len:297 (-) Transcript_66650:578-1468(-)